MRTFRVWYDGCLQKSPLLTKCITSGVLFALGDMLAQRLEANGEPRAHEAVAEKPVSEPSWDYKRTARMVIWGGVLFAPVGHGWYNLLERMVRSSGKAAVMQKIALDQLVYTPPLTLAFFTTTKLMEEATMDKFPYATSHAFDKLVPTLKVNWTVWPVIHLCTFTVVPLQYRILFINCMSIGWSAFLSLMSNKATGPTIVSAAL